MRTLSGGLPLAVVVRPLTGWRSGMLLWSLLDRAPGVGDVLGWRDSQQILRAAT